MLGVLKKIIVLGVILALFCIGYFKIIYIPSEINKLNTQYENLNKKYLSMNVIHAIKNLYSLEKDTYKGSNNSIKIPDFILKGFSKSLVMNDYKNMYHSDPKDLKILWKIRNKLQYYVLTNMEASKLLSLYLYTESNLKTIDKLSIYKYKKNICNLQEEEVMDVILLFYSGCNESSEVYKMLVQKYISK